MKILSLLRHAKSDWADPAVRDFDRPLNERGIRGARAMGVHMLEQNFHCDLVLASPAVRVVETIENIEAATGFETDAVWDRRIYLASSVTLMEVLRGAEHDPGHILMVGHNPGLEDLILDLVPDDGSSPLRKTVEDKFPTAAWARLELDIDTWTDLTDKCGALTVLVYPRDIDPSLGPQDD
jgi:phosphohistidine phosphatase